MACNCNEGNVYNLQFGCVKPALANPNAYYTKSEIDEKLEEIVISGCGITSGEVQTMIDESIPTNVSAFYNDVPYLTEHQSLSGYATEQWVESQGYLTEHQSLEGYVTENDLTAYTYDKETIDEKVAGGGTFDPTQYYNKTETNNLLDNKLDASAYTPTDLTNYYNKTEVNNIVNSAKTEIEGEIPSLSGYATEQWVENKHYITGVDLSNYALKSEIPTVPTSNSAFTNDMHYLTSADTATYVTSGNVETQIVNHFWCGSEQQWSQISGNTQPNTLYLVY